MANWKQEDLEQTLRAKGWYKSQNPIANGTQYRLVDDTPVSFYPSTGKVLVQGKDTPLRKEVEAFFKGVPVESDGTEFRAASVAVSPSEQAGGLQPKQGLPKRVFIVYGHDLAAREQLELFLRRLHVDPVVLQNLSGGGDTIIENLDALTNADFACVLLTPDDEGKRQGDESPLKPRARQNVVLEMGMVLARLGRQRVAILVKDTKGKPIERPTDIEGIIYIPFEDHINEAKIKLATRLQESGFEINVADLEG